MTPNEVEAIAEEASNKAIQKLFLMLGYDITNHTEILKMQDDLKFVRRFRTSSEMVVAHSFKTTIGILVAGALGWIAMHLFKWG